MRALSCFFVLLCVSLILPGPLLSADLKQTAALEEKISKGALLADLLQYAYQTNPSIKAAREGWRAVIGRYRVETAYPDPK